MNKLSKKDECEYADSVLQVAMKEGEQAGINLSVTIIHMFRSGKSIEEIAKETGTERNIVETICKSLH